MARALEQKLGESYRHALVKGLKDTCVASQHSPQDHCSAMANITREAINGFINSLEER